MATVTLNVFDYRPYGSYSNLVKSTAVSYDDATETIADAVATLGAGTLMQDSSTRTPGFKVFTNDSLSNIVVAVMLSDLTYLVKFGKRLNTAIMYCREFQEAFVDESEVLLSEVSTGTINEATSAAGVTIDGVLAKDSVITAGFKLPAVEKTVTDAALALGSVRLELKHNTTPVVITCASIPAAGHLFAIVNTSASGTAAHTVTLPAGVTFANGTLATDNVATLDAPGEMLLCYVVSATKVGIVMNIGSVATTTV